MDPLLLVALTVLLALVFDLTNGWNDAANAIATVVGTRVLSPLTAVFMGAGMNFVGALFSSEVAKTVGRDIVDEATLNSPIGPVIFLSAVAFAPAWITFCTFRGLPISCSHALMGALVGAALASGTGGAVHADGIRKILFGIFTAPLIGFVLGMILVVIVAWTCRGLRPKLANGIFGRLQIVSAAAMAFSHGTGDAQKAMGIVTGALVAAGFQAKFEIPLWVRLACATAMGIGTIVGGWAVMRTLGQRLTHLRTYQGFAAEAAASTTILVNTLTGVPISTTHSITGAIMGVGAAHGVRTVRWSVGKKIVYAWIFTLPVCMVGGAAFLFLFRLLGI